MTDLEQPRRDGGAHLAETGDSNLHPSAPPAFRVRRR
jgi:hypothetical protein